MDNMTFEQAEQLLTTAQKDRIARCLWEELKLPQGLNEVEKAFAFGLYTFVQYEDRGALRQYFAPEEGQPAPEHAAHVPEEPPVCRSPRPRSSLLPLPRSRNRPRKLPCQKPRPARMRVWKTLICWKSNIRSRSKSGILRPYPRKPTPPPSRPRRPRSRARKKEDGPCIPISRTSPTSSRRIWRRW